MMKFGIIGFGRHAVKRLIPAFEIIEDAEIVAIQKRQQDAVGAACAKYGIPRGYTDVDALLKDREVDVVFIASPPALHHEQVLQSARAGKPILLEKPMSANAAEAEEMVRVCHENHTLFSAGFCMRNVDSIAVVKDLLDSGRIGEIGYVEARFTYDANLSDRGWLHDPIMSAGGPVADLGSHMIDIISYLFRERFVDVRSFLRPAYTETDIEKQGLIILQMESGKMASVHTSFELPRSKSMVFHGAKGVMHLAEFSLTHSDIDIHIETADSTETISVHNDDHFVNMIRQFMDDVRKGGPMTCPGEVGLANQRILDIVYGRD